MVRRVRLAEPGAEAELVLAPVEQLERRHLHVPAGSRRRCRRPAGATCVQRGSVGRIEWAASVTSAHAVTYWARQGSAAEGVGGEHLGAVDGAGELALQLGDRRARQLARRAGELGRARRPAVVPVQVTSTRVEAVARRSPRTPTRRRRAGSRPPRTAARPARRRCCGRPARRRPSRPRRRRPRPRWTTVLGGVLDVLGDRVGGVAELVAVLVGAGGERQRGHGGEGDETFDACRGGTHALRSRQTPRPRCARMARWPTPTPTRSRCTCRTPTTSGRASSSPGGPRRAASTPSGRPTAGSCAMPSCRWRRSPPATDRIHIGSGVIDIWTRNAARLASTFSTLDDLAPGRILCGLGAWWDPLATKVGIDRADAAAGDARGGRRPSAACSPTRPSRSTATHVHLDGVELDYVYQERRPKDVPIYIGATGMQMMELAGEIADGVVLNYLVDPAYNVEAMAALERGAAKAGRTLADIDRPAARRVQHRPRPRRGPRRRPADGHPVPRPAAAHHEGVRRAPGAARRDRQGADVAGDARAGRRGQPAGARRDRPALHGLRRARRGRGQGRRVRRQRLHVPDPVPARAGRRADARHVRP